MRERKILLVVNGAARAAGVRECLSQEGLQVAVSRCGADALKRLVEWGPDLVHVETAHPAGDFAQDYRRIFSFAAGAPGDLIHEASVSLDFDRAGLSPSTGYLQLFVSDVGTASRRVLIGELEE